MYLHHVLSQSISRHFNIYVNQDVASFHLMMWRYPELIVITGNHQFIFWIHSKPVNCVTVVSFGARAEMLGYYKIVYRISSQKLILYLGQVLIMMQMKNILHEEAIFLNHECYQLITHLGVFVGHKPYINQYNDIYICTY